MDNEGTATPDTQESDRQFITDAPIRFVVFEDLPPVGELGQLYRCDETREYYRWDGKRYVKLAPHETIRWKPLETVYAPLKALIDRARKCDWFYFRNSPSSKYINIRVDMRSGDCLVTDNAGHTISIEELNFQDIPRVGRPLGSKNKT